jgi:hypothetical protein
MTSAPPITNRITEKLPIAAPTTITTLPATPSSPFPRFTRLAGRISGTRLAALGFVAAPISAEMHTSATTATTTPCRANGIAARVSRPRPSSMYRERRPGVPALGRDRLRPREDGRSGHCLPHALPARDDRRQHRGGQRRALPATRGAAPPRRDVRDLELLPEHRHGDWTCAAPALRAGGSSNALDIVAVSCLAGALLAGAALLKLPSRITATAVPPAPASAPD